MNKRIQKYIDHVNTFELDGVRLRAVYDDLGMLPKFIYQVEFKGSTWPIVEFMEARDYSSDTDLLAVQFLRDETLMETLKHWTKKIK